MSGRSLRDRVVHDGGPSLPRGVSIRTLLVALATGTVAGMATFVYISDQLVPPWFTHWWGVLLVAIAGGFAHVFARSLAESVVAAFGGLVVGLVVHVGAFVSPLYVLADPPTGEEFFWFDPGVQDLLLTTLVGRAVTAAIFAYLLAFLCGWLVAVTVDGLVE